MTHDYGSAGLAETGQIVLQRENGQASTVTLEAHSWVIGRDAEVDLNLSGASVSRQHARVDRRGNDWLVTDLGSTNGTFIDGARLVPQQPTAWPAAAELTVGAYTLRRGDMAFTQDKTVYLTPEEAQALEAALQASVPDEAIDSGQPVASAPFAFDVDEMMVAGDRVSKLTLRATGNVPVTITINATSEDGKLQFRARSWRVLLIPGTLIEVRVVCAVRQRPLIGRARDLPYRFEFVSDGGLSQSFSSDVRVQPVVRLSYVLLFLLLLAAIVAAVYGLA